MNSTIRKRPGRRHAIAAIARVTIIESVRARFVWAVLMMSLFVLAIIVFVDSLSIIESADSAISIAAPVARLLAVGLLAAFVIFNTSREMENGGIELMFAAPISRLTWMTGRFAGAAVLATAIALAVAIALSPFVEPGGLIPWSVSLLGELLLVGGLGLLMAIALNKAAIAMLGFVAFYVFARVVGIIQMLQHSSADALPSEKTTAPFTSFFIDTLTLIMPRIDLMARTEWLLADATGLVWVSPTVVLPGITQVAVYILLIAIVGSIDLERRNV